MQFINAEKITDSLNDKEQKYSELMRKSFETSLKNREKADKFHDEANQLYEEIIDTRIQRDIEHI